MTPQQWARVLQAGADHANKLGDNWSPAAALSMTLVKMAAEANAIAGEQS